MKHYGISAAQKYLRSVFIHRAEEAYMYVCMYVCMYVWCSIMYVRICMYNVNMILEQQMECMYVCISMHE